MQTGRVTETPAADDPYLWLEEVTGEAALEWVRAHNEPTVASLTDCDRFRQMRAQTLEVLDTDERIPYVRRRGEFLYNFWKDAQNPKGLWRRTPLESYATDTPDWDVLIDVDALAAAEDENWVWSSVTMLCPDYTRALVSLSRGGADAVVIREFDVDARTWVTDGFVLPENKSRIDWIDHDTIWVGTDFGEQPDGHGAMTSSGYARVTKRWTRGTPLDDAITVFTGDPGDVAVSASHDSTPGFERDYVMRSTDFYNTITYELVDSALVEIEVPTDSRFSVFRNWLLVLTRSPWTVSSPTVSAPAAGDITYDADTLLVFDYDDYLAGGRDHTVLFSPDAHTSLEKFAFTRSHLILVKLRDVATEVEVITLGDWTPVPQPGLPDLATISVLDTDPDNSDEVFWTASSFTTPPALLHGDSGAPVTVIKSAPAQYDTSTVSTEQHFATSADGTEIPYFVIRDENVTSGPTLLYGYGGFQVSQTPTYTAVSGRNWISRGGIYVIANIRGGGEYGPLWHTQTQKANRHKVYEDFSAVAKKLVADGLTTPRQLAAQGGSNGGLLMGVMLTRYPELFGAIVCQVPLLDMRRYHLLLAGASWMAEYGDPDNPDEWAYIGEYSPYQHIDADTDYPPILVTTSTRDDRVHPGHARKFVARLEETGHRVSYYENIEGGHGGAADNKQSAFKSALAYEFLWRTIGSV